MNSAASKDRVVVRETQWDADPVPVGRPRVSRAAVTPAASAARQLLDAKTEPFERGYQEGLRAGREAGLREGREQGLRDGYEEGLQKGQQDSGDRIRQAVEVAVVEATNALLQQRKHFDNLVGALRAQADAVQAAAEDDVVAVCFDILCRVVGASVVSLEGVRAQVAHLHARNPERSSWVIRVHPEDARQLGTPGIHDERPSGDVTWVADSGVSLGGCIVSSSRGALDARLETILESCKSALLEARASQLAQSGGSDTA